MKAYSMVLRKRVLAICDAGRCTRELARVFDVSEPRVRRLKQRRNEDGIIGPRPSGGRRHGHFDPAHLEQLRDWLRQHPDATPEWLLRRAEREMGLRCSVMAVCRAVKKLGWSLKKTLRADEQDRADVVRRRMSLAIARRFVDLDQFLFLDESSAKTNMTRLDGRAPVGQRCYFSAPHRHGRTTTLLSANRRIGVIEEASIVFDGPTDTIVFRGYVEQCLAPSLQ